MTHEDLKQLIKDALEAPFEDENELYETLLALLRAPIDQESNTH